MSTDVSSASKSKPSWPRQPNRAFSYILKQRWRTSSEVQGITTQTTVLLQMTAAYSDNQELLMHCVGKVECFWSRQSKGQLSSVFVAGEAWLESFYIRVHLVMQAFVMATHPKRAHGTSSGRLHLHCNHVYLSQLGPKSSFSADIICFTATGRVQVASEIWS